MLKVGDVVEVIAHAIFPLDSIQLPYLGKQGKVVSVKNSPYITVEFGEEVNVFRDTKLKLISSKMFCIQTRTAGNRWIYSTIRGSNKELLLIDAKKIVKNDYFSGVRIVDETGSPVWTSTTLKVQ